MDRVGCQNTSAQDEHRLLREQSRGRRLRFTDDQRRRLAAKGRVLGRRVLGELSGLVTPDTILRWYQKLIARKYDGTGRRGTGRPATASGVQRLVVRFASENPGWGYTDPRRPPQSRPRSRAQHNQARSPRSRTRACPQRGTRLPWKTFIRAHLGAIAAADFFTVEVLTLPGPVRYFVLFVIDVATRRVQIAGIVRQPHGALMKQVARNLTDDVDGFLKGMRYLIHDRDPLFTAEHRDMLRAAGIICRSASDTCAAPSASSSSTITWSGTIKASRTS